MQLQRKRGERWTSYKGLYEGFHHAVIYDQRYLVYLDGLKVTILISIFAILIGVANWSVYCGGESNGFQKYFCQNFEVVL